MNASFKLGTENSPAKTIPKLVGGCRHGGSVLCLLVFQPSDAVQQKKTCECGNLPHVTRKEGIWQVGLPCAARAARAHARVVCDRGAPPPQTVMARSHDVARPLSPRWPHRHPATQ